MTYGFTFQGFRLGACLLQLCGVKFTAFCGRTVFGLVRSNTRTGLQLSGSGLCGPRKALEFRLSGKLGAGCWQCAVGWIEIQTHVTHVCLDFSEAPPMQTQRRSLDQAAFCQLSFSSLANTRSQYINAERLACASTSNPPVRESM